MTTLEVLRLIADNVYVNFAGHGTWEIKATVAIPRIGDEDDEVITIKEITHNEEDKTGIFDGSKYNTFCGFNSWRELKIQAADDGLTVAQFQDGVWEDTANDDNYEPANLRNLRLADRLYKHLENKDIFHELDIED